MMTAFESYFTSLQGKKIAVLGLGVSNRPLVRLLLEFGCDVTGCDKTPREKLDDEVLALEEAGCKLRVGEGYLDGVEADVLFRTPGMHPGNPAIEGLRQKGAYVTSEMEVFFEVCPCHLIAVTGSDGKTTTTTLISEMLKADGKTVWLGGNIGTPLLPLCRQMRREDYAVVELSSFQLMDMTRRICGCQEEYLPLPGRRRPAGAECGQRHHRRIQRLRRNSLLLPPGQDQLRLDGGRGHIPPG